jgi:hypothetical protein
MTPAQTDETRVDIMPCPFCGGADYRIEPGGQTARGYRVGSIAGFARGLNAAAKLVADMNETNSGRVCKAILNIPLETPSPD